MVGRFHYCSGNSAAVSSKRDHRQRKMFSRCFLPSLSYLFVVLVLRSSESLDKINAKCGEDIILPCDATRRAKLYRSITWYKVNGTRTGIIRKVKDKVQPFSAARMASFYDGESLFIPNVRPEDSGNYECLLSANVGGENRESKLHLNVSECGTPADTTPAALVTVTGLMSHSNTSCLDQEVEVSSVLIVASFAVVAFVKVILCILSVWVLLVIRTRKTRRRMDIWM